MNISYGSKELLKICTKIEEAQSRYGPQGARDLHELLAEAESFRTAKELLDFRDGEIHKGDSLLFPFGPYNQAKFEPVDAGKDLPGAKSGEIEWGQVRRIMLIEIS